MKSLKGTSFFNKFFFKNRIRIESARVGPIGQPMDDGSTANREIVSLLFQ